MNVFKRLLWSRKTPVSIKEIKTVVSKSPVPAFLALSEEPYEIPELAMDMPESTATESEAEFIVNPDELNEDDCAAPPDESCTESSA